VIFPELKNILKAHQAKGDTLVIITSATRFQVDPIARYLGIKHILCTELEEKDGLYTGRMNGPPCYGEEKLRLAKAFCGQHGLKLQSSYFYSNGVEDLPLLEAVAHPVAINPDKALARIARKRGWLSLQPGKRGSTGIKDVARTLTTFASVLPAIALGLPFRLLGSERSAINFSLATWAGFASWIAGLRLIIEDEPYLWSHRPAVFLFNHQSAMDVLITAQLMQQDVTGIAKKEIKRQPIMGPAMMALGAVFIDRDNKGDPQEALAPAIAALKEGKSVLIAPEGTRSKDERLGKFKKGAFHLAMQAGVPIVPIVIHNSLDALPNHSMVVRPAEVKVTVLKPIPTKDWNTRDLVRCAHNVRRNYLRVLDQNDTDSD
jgi:putative phosphoserine phosphatase/1-acylglycerol-3-phosphate O-acyltransferase